jgi:hypothetical protein
MPPICCKTVSAFEAWLIDLTCVEDDDRAVENELELLFRPLFDTTSFSTDGKGRSGSWSPPGMDACEDTDSLLNTDGVESTGGGTYPPLNINEVDVDLKLDGPDAMLLVLGEHPLKTNGFVDGVESGANLVALLGRGNPPLNMDPVDDGLKRGTTGASLLALRTFPSSTAGVDDGLKLGDPEDGVKKRGVSGA